MRLTVIVIFFLTYTVQIFAQESATPSFETKSFRSEISNLYKELRLPGLSVAVVHNGQIIYRQTEGFADLEKKTPIRADSIFPIASVTKTFTAVMMMKYAEEGKINLDDYLLKYPYTRIGWSVSKISPEAKLVNILSHTSEGTPGDHFIYNAGRFNYLYGVFEKISGQLTIPKAYPEELRKNIIEPLGLKSTISGFPIDMNDPLYSRIVTPYRYDKDKGFTVDKGTISDHDSYPSSGILTNIDDLAVYARSLDENLLITAASYKKMTTSHKNKARLTMPYALGWFSEKYDGLDFHWAYGLGDSYSSLLIRVPEKRLTFILLCNASFTSGALRLGNGYLLQSPFAVSFIKHFVLYQKIKPLEIDYDSDIQSIRKDFLKILSSGSNHSIYLKELFAQALIRQYVKTKFGEDIDKSKKLLELLYELKPTLFDHWDPSITYLLAEIHDRSLEAPAERAINAFNRSGHFHTDVISDIIRYYTKTQQETKALKYYHRLADSQRFEERKGVIDACAYLGKYYLPRNVTEGRKYFWKAITAAKNAGYNDTNIDNLVQEMNKLNP